MVDALSCGADAGTAHTALLLSDGGAVPAPELAMLDARKGGKIGLLVYGGPNAVPDSAVSQAADTLFGPGNWTSIP